MGGDEVTRMSPPEWDQCPCKRPERAPAPPFPRGSVVKRQPSTRKRRLPDTDSARGCVSGFAASRAVRKKLLLFVMRPVYGIAVIAT